MGCYKYIEENNNLTAEEKKYLTKKHDEILQEVKDSKLFIKYQKTTLIPKGGSQGRNNVQNFLISINTRYPKVKESDHKIITLTNNPLNPRYLTPAIKVTRLVRDFRKQKNNGVSVTKTNKKYKKDIKLKEKYFQKSNETTTSVILDKISKSNHVLNVLAEKLKEYNVIQNSIIELVDADFLTGNFKVEKVKKASALYNPLNRKIKIAKNANFVAGNAEAVILHEILHSYTYYELQTNTEAVKEFKKLYNLAKKELDPDNKLYALSDVDEFMVGIFTDSDLIFKLQELPSQNSNFKNMFEEIFNFIISLFKITKKDTLYDTAFSVATNIINDAKERNDYLDLNNGNDMFTDDISPDFFTSSEENNQKDLTLSENTSNFEPSQEISIPENYGSKIKTCKL